MILTINGIEHTVRDWSKISGVTPKTIYKRLLMGRSPKRAVFEIATKSHVPGERHPWKNYPG